MIDLLRPQLQVWVIVFAMLRAVLAQADCFSRNGRNLIYVVLSLEMVKAKRFARVAMSKVCPQLSSDKSASRSELSHDHHALAVIHFAANEKTLPKATGYFKKERVLLLDSAARCINYY